MLPNTSAYVKSCYGWTKWIDLLYGYDDLFKKCNIIWDKVSADIEKELDSELVYNKEYLKSKISSHGDEVTDFYDKNISKFDSNWLQLDSNPQPLSSLTNSLASLAKWLSDSLAKWWSLAK